jgi:hypothetical protein
MLLKKKAEKERLAAEEARLFKNLNEKLNQISTSKEAASKSLEENTRLAANISKWVHSIRDPFVKTIEMLKEEDSLDDSSWCSDIAEEQISKLPMRLDTYIEKRVKHQFSALIIQKVVRGWIVRKKLYVTREVFSDDLGLYKMRGDLVKEHAAAVAVEDMALEDSFTSENDNVNFEGQFYKEQNEYYKKYPTEALKNTFDYNNVKISPHTIDRLIIPTDIDCFIFLEQLDELIKYFNRCFKTHIKRVTDLSYFKEDLQQNMYKLHKIENYRKPVLKLKKFLKFLTIHILNRLLNLQLQLILITIHLKAVKISKAPPLE